jgi:hypothetical protein
MWKFEGGAVKKGECAASVRLPARLVNFRGAYPHRQAPDALA